ncbi:MAG: recombinase family protein [Promethearchaeota archaeon]
MKAAIYCRVSTEGQEQEGTSLQTQLEACLKYCKQKGYEVVYQFSEAWSGLSLERPQLTKLREIIRNENIDAVVVYSLDRFSRDPVHGVILMQEFERHHILFECVTEDVDNSELGKLISYIRGYASKLEAEKIKERTMRGKRVAQEAGRIYTGSGIGIYGYDYLKRIKGERQANRVMNDIEAKWVKKIYEWLVYESLSINAIVYRLRALEAPTKAGGEWGRSSVHKILKNSAYAGYSNATPSIIEKDLFEAAQKKLRLNLKKSPRNTKYEYLLRGHIRCRHCGQAYTGEPHRGKTYYRCLGRRRINTKSEICRNKTWNADNLETIVWNEIENYLSDPNVIRNELEKRKQTASQLDVFEEEIINTELRIKELNKEQKKLLQWALKGFPSDQVESENKRINQAKETLNQERIEIELKLNNNRDSIVNIQKFEDVVKDIKNQLPNLDFEGKRLALDFLDITIWIDSENVNITGAIEAQNSVQSTSTIL